MRNHHVLIKILKLRILDVVEEVVVVGGRRLVEVVVKLSRNLMNG